MPSSQHCTQQGFRMNVLREVARPTERPSSAAAPVKLTVFQSWCPALDEAAANLPEDSDWPRELYTALAKNVPERAGRFVMWTERDVPVGVAAFVRRPQGIWEPVTHWILPGLVGLAVPSRIGELFAQLPFCTRVAWWRMVEPVPSGGHVRHAATQSTYGMSCSANFEAYWKQTGQLRAVKKARDRCRDFAVSYNEPGIGKWVLQQAGKHWLGGDRADSSHLANRALTAGYLEALGKLLTIALRDGQTLVAAEACIIHRQDLVLWTTFRDRSYDYHGLGNRLMELAYHRARDHGLAGIDIGGGFMEYKRRWAPQAGTKARLLISPLVHYAEYKLRRALSSAWNGVSRKLEKLLAAVLTISALFQRLQEDGLESLVLSFLAV